MDYCFPFLCFITLGGSTTTKVFAVHDHTHSHDSKIVQEAAQVTENSKIKKLCIISRSHKQYKSTIFVSFGCWVAFLSALQAQGCFWDFFHVRTSPELALDMQEIYSLQPVSYCSLKCMLIFFYWSHWKSTEPSFPIISQQLSSVCWPQCCSMWLWIPLCRRSCLPLEMRGCDYL